MIIVLSSTLCGGFVIHWISGSMHLLPTWAAFTLERNWQKVIVLYKLHYYCLLPKTPPTPIELLILDHYSGSISIQEDYIFLQTRWNYHEGLKLLSMILDYIKAESGLSKAAKTSEHQTCQPMIFWSSYRFSFAPSITYKICPSLCQEKSLKSLGAPQDGEERRGGIRYSSSWMKKSKNDFLCPALWLGLPDQISVNHQGRENSLRPPTTTEMGGLDVGLTRWELPANAGLPNLNIFSSLQRVEYISAPCMWHSCSSFCDSHFIFLLLLLLLLIVPPSPPSSFSSFSSLTSSSSPPLPSSDRSFHSWFDRDRQSCN